MVLIWDLWDLSGIYAIYLGFMGFIRKEYGIFFSDIPPRGTEEAWVNPKHVPGIRIDPQ